VTLALTGYGVARGIAIGRSHLFERNELQIGEHRISEDEVDNEIQRFRAAIRAARRQLERVSERVGETVAMTAGEIIQTHLLMLSDSAITQNTEDRIREQLCNAEWALQSQLEELLSRFRSMEDEYLRTRGEDAAQVVTLIQAKLSDEPETSPLEDIPDRLADTLVVATELMPAELAVLHERGVAGIVTEHGGPHSHTAILASSLGIPAVLGVRRAQSLLREGEDLILDGGQGMVYASPDENIRKHYREVQRETRRFRESLEAIRERPATSLDGQEISLQANAERAEEIRQALESNASEIGLYRTEFLYLRGGPPDEDTQLAEYAAAIEALQGRPVTIRTLDMGADKSAVLPDLEAATRGANPAMGLRAVRLCLRDTERFKVQLRAILRAGALGPVRCLIPMLTTVHEIRMVRSLIAEARRELELSGLDHDPAMQVGGMIEVPAAAMALSDLGRFLDFISIGTNDLLQYTLAADRIDEQVAHLYELEHPGIVRLLRHIFRDADRLDIPVTVCGEAAGDSRYTRLLLSLGLKRFSMNPARLLEVKQVVLQTDIPRAMAALTRWLDGTGPANGQTLLAALDESQT
jgi:phosphotransferase system enzyme I (PtsI)